MGTDGAGTFMGHAIADVLPLAMGVAISPVPIIAAILILLSPEARSTSVAFLAGWLLGIIIPVVVFTFVAGLLPESDPELAHPIAGVVQLVLGLLVFSMGWRQWAGRPSAQATVKLPQWMDDVESMSALRVFALGFVLAAVNPKNLSMGISAGVAAGSEGLALWSSAIVITVFTLLACSTVAVPVIACLVAPDRMRGPLDAMQTWLSQHHPSIMAVVLVVLGTVMFSDGISRF